MTVFYKGVGAGRFLYAAANDPMARGISAQDPGGAQGVDVIMRHVVHGTTNSPYISLTKSYGVAADYARNGSAVGLSGYVFEISLDKRVATVTLVDPVYEVGVTIKDPLIDPSYHHTGDMNYLLGVVDPIANRLHLAQKAPQPAGSNAPVTQPHLSLKLVTVVRALRDAEVLALGTIPRTAITAKHIV